jgi:hypothetical protein
MYPGMNISHGLAPAHERTFLAYQMTLMFDWRNDEHEAVGVTYVSAQARMLLDYGRGAYAFADPADEALYLDVTTGRGSEITQVGPVFPGYVPSGERDAYVEMFTKRAADHLRDSIPAILRALERSEFRPAG